MARFDYVMNVRDTQPKTCTREIFEQLLARDDVRRTCAAIASVVAQMDIAEQLADEEVRRSQLNHLHDEVSRLKRELPAFTFFATFGGKARKMENATPSGLAYLDLDHVRDPQALWASLEMSTTAELLRQIPLVHVTPSGRGLRIVFEMQPCDASVEAAQDRMAQALGIHADYDAVCKDLTRLSFAVPKAYVLRYDENLTKTPSSLRTPRTPSSLPLKGEGGMGTGLERVEMSSPSASQTHSAPSLEGGRGEGLEGAGAGAAGAGLLFKRIPYSSIISAYWQRTGGEPQMGERNVRLYQLAVNLRAICDNKREVLMQVMPRFGLSDQELQGIVDSACKETPKGISKMMRDIILNEQRKMADEQCEPASGSDVLTQTGERGEGLLPPMPKRLSPLIKLLTSRVDTIYKPCVGMSVFAPLCTHLVDVRWRYIDRVEHEPGDMCLLMAPMSSGKSSIGKPIEFIISDIVERDNLSRQREQAWREQVNSKGANKEKPARPTDLCVQVLVPDMTNAAFVQRLQDAGKKPVYTQMNELDLLTQLRTNGKSGTPTQILRLSYDRDMYGQERVGTQAVNARVRVRWNLNMSTTIQKGQHYFRQAIADGTLSRLSLCTIQPEPGAQLPLFGLYDEAFAADLRPYIDRLNAASGLIACPQAERLVRRLLATAQEAANTADDEVARALYPRALVLAYNRAMTLFVAEGRWSKDIETFVEWSYQYDMAVKRLFFGEQLTHEMQGEVVQPRRGPRSLLDLMPDVFSESQLAEIHRQQGKSGNVRNLLSAWMHRKYISLQTDGRLAKIPRQRRDDKL